MEFMDYQRAAHRTAKYPVPRFTVGSGADEHTEAAPYVYPAMGLSGEAGEVANKVKKLMRDFLGQHGSFEYDAHLDKIKDELGDVLWYVAELATVFDWNLGRIAEANLLKLGSRYERNVIHGDGDDR